MQGGKDEMLDARQYGTLRLSVSGPTGSGKSTLVHLLAGKVCLALGTNDAPTLFSTINARVVLISYCGAQAAQSHSN